MTREESAPSSSYRSPSSSSACAMAALVKVATEKYRTPRRVPRPPWIVLPTYDEAESLPGVLRGIAAALPGAHVLVVDDASPDGTAAVARGLGAEVLPRPRKLGLGPAYVAGFAHA